MSDTNGTVEDESSYGYIPSRPVAIIFLSLFGISTVVHVGQMIKYRMWWLIPTVCLCGLLELLGWSARLWSSFEPLDSTPFQIQIIGTIIGPTPLVAANFVIFGRIVQQLGSSYSRLSPKLYTIIFTTCDVVSLVIQGTGGGMAATADTREGAKTGANVMLCGTAFQVAILICFSICAIEYFVRYHKRTPLSARTELGDRTNSDSSTLFRGRFRTNLKLMSYALAFSTLVLFIRAIYRTIELADGWHGRIISTELYFNVLDGAMIVLAIYTLNLAHPGKLLAVPEANFKYISA